MLILIIFIIFISYMSGYNLKYAISFIPCTALNFISYTALNKSVVVKTNIKNNNRYIPKTVHCTYHNKDKIPKRVIENLKKYCKGYEIKIYDDDNCKKIIKQVNPSLVKRFDNLAQGAHKADLFRYCVLYLYGGVYVDIKTDFVKDLDKIIDHNKKNTLYTVLMVNRPTEKRESKLIKYLRMNLNIPNGQIYQGFIASYPKNPIFIELITHIYNTKYVLRYGFSISRFYDLIRNETKHKLVEGVNKTKKYGNLILFSEFDKKITKNEQLDCRDGYWKVFKNNKVLFKTRYNSYPW